MVRFLNSPKNSAVLALLLFASPASALDVPTGTEIQVRLTAKISTDSAKANDPVEAVVIAPVTMHGQFVIPATAVVRGTVNKLSQSTQDDERSSLLLNFTEIEFNGARHKLSAQVSAVENAREKVDDQGQINGILASETLTGRLDSGIDKVTEKYSGFGGFLAAAKKAVLKAADTGITYDAGVEMTLKLAAPLTVKGPCSPGPLSKLKPFADPNTLSALVAREPFQTIAQNPPKPSDITNIMLIGTEDQVRAAFKAAGWSTATKLSTEAKFQTFRAIAEDRGYQEAPVSILLLDGRPPDIVFEKMTNTFEKRHHLRVWRSPVTFHGMPVWDIAATHDTGISFSEANRTFIHKIDSEIDKERAKVVNDLVFAGRVQSLEMVDRPQVPKTGQNATGDDLKTDAKIAVMLLN
jgi:LssY C-terminus